MRVSDLLLAMLRVAIKARDVARIIRSEPALLNLLVEEKTGSEKNKRFSQDFKTLADVLIQQMVSHDLGLQFPELEDSIFGEESNKFTNVLGETITVQLCSTQEQTKILLKDILDGNEEAARLLAEVVHEEGEAPPVIPELNTLHIDLPSADVGIWIDPIDSTAQYISGEVGLISEDGVDSGLRCVAVLIGAFQKSTGLPIIGVSVQPFRLQDPSTKKWSSQTTWGVCYEDLCLSSVLSSAPQSPTYKSLPQPTIILSTSEVDKVKELLREKFNIRYASGAGYKLLLTAQQKVAAYVLSKSSIYLWDCCAPHAILRATGGGVMRFYDTMAALEAEAKKGQAEQKNGMLSAETLQSLEVLYSASANDSKKVINGVIAYSSPNVLNLILQSLAVYGFSGI